MAKQRLTINEVGDNFVELKFGSKITANAYVTDLGVLITSWKDHEPHMGWDEKALRAIRNKYGSIAVPDVGSTDPRSREYDSTMYWQEHLDAGLVDAIQVYDHELRESIWLGDDPDENPRGGKRRIPRKKKKIYIGFSDDIFDSFSYDYIEDHATKISRHLFMQHLYKNEKRRVLPTIEEQAGYGADDPMNQAIDVEYFLSHTRNGIELVYFKTPKTGDTLWVFAALGNA